MLWDGCLLQERAEFGAAAAAAAAAAARTGGAPASMPSTMAGRLAARRERRAQVRNRNREIKDFHVCNAVFISFFKVICQDRLRTNTPRQIEHNGGCLSGLHDYRRRRRRRRCRRNSAARSNSSDARRSAVVRQCQPPTRRRIGAALSADALPSDLGWGSSRAVIFDPHWRCSVLDRSMHRQCGSARQWHRRSCGLTQQWAVPLYSQCDERFRHTTTRTHAHAHARAGSEYWPTYAIAGAARTQLSADSAEISASAVQGST
eukprot:COSAG06_NODE_12082_length_1426_cov_1.347400_2_plen_261_part_00